MIARADYMPRSDAEFDRWLLNFCDYVAYKTGGARPAWSDVPAAEAARLLDAYDGWRALCAAPASREPWRALAMNEARSRAEFAVGVFVERYLRLAPLTDDDRAWMGFGAALAASGASAMRLLEAETEAGPYSQGLAASSGGA